MPHVQYLFLNYKKILSKLFLFLFFVQNGTVKIIFQMCIRDSSNSVLTWSNEVIWSTQIRISDIGLSHICFIRIPDKFYCGPLSFKPGFNVRT